MTKSLKKDYLNSLKRHEREELLLLLEEKRRRNAANSLINYAKYIEIPSTPVNDDEDCEEFYPDNVTPAKHHELILDYLQRLAEGEITRLMIFMPPGSAKSTYASVVFPTWFMGKYPRSNIIMATYGSDLAKKFGRKCRQVAKSEQYKELFNHHLTGDNAAADDWSITNGSTYMCGGILSGLTGNRADLLVIDDPVKGREDADSETIRNKTWDEYKDSAMTRLKPKGRQIIINTRWHEDDICGRILPDNYNGETGVFTGKDGAEWHVLSLQAQCESENDPLGRKQGEWLWTEWFSVDWWEQTKRTYSTPSTRSWNSLYQQRPAPEEGDFFKLEWFRYYKEKPKDLRIYGTSDYATKEGKGDWTVHAVWGIDPDDNIFLLDLWRGQTDSLVWVEQLLSLAAQYKPQEWGEESGQIINSMGPVIERRQRETNNIFYRRQYPSTADKSVRAQSFRAYMALGKVYFPEYAEWLPDLKNELLTFPAGRHDDQVDACSLIGRMLDRLLKGEKSVTTKARPIEAMPTLKEITDEMDARWEQQKGNEGLS